MAKKETRIGMKIIIGLLILFGLAIIGSFLAALIMIFSGVEGSFGANVAVIPVEGVLLATGGGGFGSDILTSEDLIEDIEYAEEDDNIEAVVFLINSPGGSAVASDEIATAILEMEKPSVAVIREVGASGGYWVASANDHIVANRMSVTGSIGVIGSYLSFGRFLDRYNVTYNQLISGDRKDAGTPFRELDADERAYIQEKLDAIHWYFIQAVAANRNMSAEDVDALADGSILLGYEALELGLIDELGGEQEALDWINATLHIEPVTVVYEHEPSLMEVLAGLRADPLAGLDAGVSVPMAR